MNKYSSLKTHFLKEFPQDDFYKSYGCLRSVTPRGNISEFTIRQNHSSFKLMSHPSVDSSVPSSIVTALPTSRDFSELINKLDQVVSPKGEKDQFLPENEAIECTIKENSFLYFKITVKQKPSPLRVSIKKTQGKFLIYTSFLDPKPGPSHHDEVFSSEYFEIKHLHQVFSENYLYLGIRALVYTKLSISCLFGKKSPKRNIKKETETTEIRIRVRSNKNLPKRQGKNFIEQNFKLRILSPEQLKKKSLDWQMKREKVVNKKKENLKDKKEKALNFLNRKEIRNAQSKIEAHFKLQQEIKVKQAEDWITFLYLFKATQNMHEIRSFKRQQIGKKLTETNKARVIQRLYRQSTKNFNISFLVITRAQDLINLFNTTSCQIFRVSAAKTLISVIKKTGTCRKPFLSFSKYMKKIELIQRSYRKYLGLKAERLRKLIIFWDECKSFENKRSLKRKTVVYELNISIYQRNIVLSNYYIECVKKFYLSLREGKKKTWRRDRFYYMPSHKDMKKLIESVTEVQDRVYVTEGFK